MEWVRAVSRRRISPWMRGLVGVVHHDTHELCVVESGRLHVHLDGRDGAMSGGEAVLIPAGVVHGSWTEADPVEEIVVHLDAAALNGRFGALAAGVRALGDDEGAVLRALRVAAVDARVDRALAPALALVERFAAEASPVVSDPRLVRVMDAVRADFAADWSVDRLASIAAMSADHFSRAFKQAVGEAPMQWVVGRRVERAAWLMRTSSSSLSEIALSAGFRTPSRLTEAFTRRYGEPPSAWRARR